MAKGRELKRRIKTVENTRKITRTMELVATSRMKRAQDRVTAIDPSPDLRRARLIAADAGAVWTAGWSSVSRIDPALVRTR